VRVYRADQVRRRRMQGSVRVYRIDRKKKNTVRVPRCVCNEANDKGSVRVYRIAEQEEEDEDLVYKQADN